MNYTKEMATNEICLELVKIRSELLDTTSRIEKSIEKIVKNMVVKYEIEDRPSGEWVDDTNTQGYVYCSQCNKMFNAYSTKTRYNYCPSCGARMKGDDSK